MSEITQNPGQPSITIEVENIQNHAQPKFILKQGQNVLKRTNTGEIKYVTIIKDEPEEELPCEYCTKTFFNEIALTNHIKMQHASALSNDSSVLSTITYTSTSLNESYKKIAAYQAPAQKIVTYPKLSNMNKAVIVGTDGSIIEQNIRRSNFSNQSPSRGNHLVSLASEDVSYIIIKTEGEEETRECGKRQRRSDVGVRRAGNDGKQQVELTGPFECLQPSNFLPQGTCHQIFFNCCEYSIHYREEHTKRRKAALRCQVCEKRLDQDLDPKSGVFSMPFSTSSDQSVFACNLCGKAFKDSFQLDDHRKSHHIKLKPFQCKICLKRFTQQGGLQQHMRMHTGDRPFPCTFCNKSFTQKAGLDQHLRIHTKIKPFRCVVCSKSFSQSVHLRQHMRTHTNIQPFECGVCGKRFKQSSHLNFHLKCHSNETEGMTEEQREIHRQNVAIHQAKLMKATNKYYFANPQSKFVKVMQSDNVDDENLMFDDQEIVIGQNHGGIVYQEGEEQDGIVYVEGEEEDGVVYQEDEEQDADLYEQGEEQDGTEEHDGTYQEGEDQVAIEYQEEEQHYAHGEENDGTHEHDGIVYQNSEEQDGVAYQDGEEQDGTEYQEGEEQEGIEYQVEDNSTELQEAES